MKTTLIAAIAAMSVSSAQAGDITYGGYSEYSVEVKEFALGVNAGYTFDNGLATKVTFEGTDSCKTGITDCGFGFNEAEVSVAYPFNNHTSVYTEVTFDNKFKYAETVVGVAIQF